MASRRAARRRPLSAALALCAPVVAWAVRSQPPWTSVAAVEDFDRGAAGGGREELAAPEPERLEGAAFGALLQRDGGMSDAVLELDGDAAVAPEEQPESAPRRGHIRMWPTRALGSGAFGRVFAGEVIDTKQPVAIKVFKSQSYMARSRTALRLFDSPNIVRCVGSLSTVYAGQELYMLAMTMADCDLASVLERMEPNSLSVGMPRNSTLSLVDVLSDVLHALRSLDDRGVVHRDIKPENIVLVWNETLRRHVANLADFDIACMPCGMAAMAHDLLCTSWAGTRRYFAPELLKRYKRLEDGTKVYDPYTPDHKHDVFAAALSLLSTPEGFVLREWAPAIRRAIASGVHGDVADLLAARQAMVLKGFPRRLFDALTRRFESWWARAPPEEPEVAEAARRFHKVLAWMIMPEIEDRCTAAECLELLKSD